MTAPATARKSASQSSTQCLPLSCIPDPEDPEARASGSRVVGDFSGGWEYGFARIHRAQWASSTGADGLPWRTDTSAGPFLEQVFDDSIFA